MVDKNMLVRQRIQPEAAKLLANYANHGIAQATWLSYNTVSNHLVRYQEDTGMALDLPFTTEKTLSFVAWLIEKRRVKPNTIKNI